MAFFKKNYYFIVAMLLLMLVLIAWGANYFLLIDNAERGTFGDMFGGLNALFSGCAFVGVIVAILMQSAELKLQREELTDTRKVLDGQKEQLEAQSITLSKQNFENTFFELLRMHNDITNSIDLVSKSAKITKGRDCFSVFNNRLLTYLNLSEHSKYADEPNKYFDHAYNRFCDENKHEIEHYFRCLYSLIKFVDKSDIKDKVFYVNIVRAQLSTFEVIMLFYNCISPHGRDKFLPLAKKYSLLKNLQKELIFSENLLVLLS